MTATTDTPPAADASQRPTRYRFGPRETRGLLLGLRAGQLTLLIGGLAALVAGLSLGQVGAVLGLLLLAAAAAAAFVPIGGRTVEQWAPVAAGFGWQHATGQQQFRAGPATGTLPARQGAGSPAVLDLPGALAGFVLLPVPVDGGATVGVIKDPARGLFTAVIAVRGSTFALLETAEQDRRIDAWGALLAGMAREGSPVVRIQWVERTLPDSGDALLRYWARAGRQDRSAAARSYLELIEGAGPLTQSHETYLAVAIDARRTRRPAGRSGGDAGACAVLLRELAALEQQLSQASIEVVGWLPPRALAGVLRGAFEPGAAARLDRRAEVGAGAGVTPAAAGPMAANNGWASYRTDDGWHATYWICEWPRMGVTADFLAPLLLHTACRRAVSLVAEPINPRRAARGVASARTAELANQALRERVGQLTTARHQREAEAVEQREAELVAGHAEFAFTGYLTVTALDPGGLEEACGQVEHAAHQSLLEIRRMYGQQDQAFAFTLPLARGLH